MGIAQIIRFCGLDLRQSAQQLRHQPWISPVQNSQLQDAACTQCPDKLKPSRSQHALAVCCLHVFMELDEDFAWNDYGRSGWSRLR